jgi:predicted phosphodiesterase
MRIAVISDIHGNLPALEAVMSRIESDGADFLHCCGDMVGYCAEPGACVDIIRAKADTCIRGNHEVALLDPRQADSFNEYAREAIYWTMGALDKSQLDYIKSLSDNARWEDFILATAACSTPTNMSSASTRRRRVSKSCRAGSDASGIPITPRLIRWAPTRL